MRERPEPPVGPATIIFVVLIVVAQVAGTVWAIKETLERL